MNTIPTTIVLAGGLATRLYPITKTVPKSLITIDDKAFIEYQIELLRRNGIKKIVFCIGHMGDQIKRYLLNEKFSDLNISFSEDGNPPLGTGGAIKKAARDVDGYFFTMYGDSYLDCPMLDIFEFFKKSNKKALMTVFNNKNQYDKSNVVFENDTIKVYDKNNYNDNMNYIDYGLGVMSFDCLQSINKDQFDLAVCYSKWAKDNDLAGYEVKNRFYEVGSEKGILDFTNHICSKD